MSDREKVQHRFEEAGLSAERYVNVNDGEKGTYNHATSDTPPAGNYGIYANEGDALVIFDVDDYEDHDSEGLRATGELPTTLIERTPHDGRHRFFKIETPDDRPPAAWLEAELGTANPNPSYGEVRAENQYVVAAGSELDGCDKDWCDSCDGDGGKYELLGDREIATIGVQELLEVLKEDSDITPESEESDDASANTSASVDSSDKKTRAEKVAEENPDTIKNYLEYGADDRSDADWAACCTLIKYGVDESEAYDLLNGSARTKVAERGMDYWRDTWNGAKSEVGSDENSKALREEKDRAEAGQHTSWDSVVRLFRDDETPDTVARRAGAIALMERDEYLYDDTNDRLLKYYDDDGVFELGGARDAKKVLVKELGSTFSTHDRNEIIATIEDMTAVDVDDLNAEEYDEKLLCVGNGVLNLETRELLDHSPDYKFTRALPVDYDPDVDAPACEEFLGEITTGEAYKETLEEMMGAALHPQYLKSKFLFLFGDGQNGKGIYFKLLRSLLGEENVEGRGLHELADERFAKADLHGKLANIGGDIDDRKLKNVGELKRLTSGTDPVTAEKKYGQPFKFINSTTLYFAANEPPAIEDQKRSMARRLVPVHLETEFVENPDPDDPRQKQARDEETLLEEMTTDSELSGLLNLALDGMNRLSDNGDVSHPMPPMERLEYYQRFSDPIYRFARECMDERRGVRVNKADVYELYRNFSKQEGHGVRHNSTFWREFKRVFHYDEIHPSDGDGGHEPRQLQDADFSEGALKKYASQKLADKYGVYDDEREEEEDTPFNAVPVDSAASSATGYETVTVKVATTERIGDDNQGMKATLVDESGPIDFVGWDSPLADELEKLEGECVVVQSAEVKEYEGKKQLQPREDVTSIESIQAGVGYAPGQQSDSMDIEDSAQAATDGGEKPASGGVDPSGVDADASGLQADADRVAGVLRDMDTPASRGAIVQEVATARELMDLDRAKDALEHAENQRDVSKLPGGVYDTT